MSPRYEYNRSSIIILKTCNIELKVDSFTSSCQNVCILNMKENQSIMRMIYSHLLLFEELNMKRKQQQYRRQNPHLYHRTERKY